MSCWPSPRGPIDPTASVKRGVFAPADTWISTEYLFRRDDDGDFWRVDSRGSVIRTPRGVVYAATVNDALGRINAVDLAVTYGVTVDDGRCSCGDGAGAAAGRHHYRRPT